MIGLAPSTRVWLVAGVTGGHGSAFSCMGPTVERSEFPCNFKHIAHLLARMCIDGGMVNGGGGGNRIVAERRGKKAL
jgi:hypothetical protein